jgi:ACR3 family arsenite transporter
MIWNQLACGDPEMCAIIVVFNSLLQIVLYAPFAILFINVIGGDASLKVSYSDVAISVVIVRVPPPCRKPLTSRQYLGIPLVAGAFTRYAVWGLTSKSFLETKFLPYFGPLALVGLLYTIFVLFAYQGNQIVSNIGPVFRTIGALLPSEKAHTSCSVQSLCCSTLS